jgi:hypothetical protein
MSRDIKGETDMKNSMSSNKLFLCGLTTIGIVLSSVSIARSQESEKIPKFCSQDDPYGAKERAYNAGEMSGEALVARMWDILGNDCDELELLSSIALSNFSHFALPEAPSSTVACRYGGYIKGLLAKLYEAYRYCEEQYCYENDQYRCDELCSSEGEWIGEITATAYCELSIALLGLEMCENKADCLIRTPVIRPPIPICGLNSEFACDVAYTYQTTVYENPNGACYYYCYDGYFSNAWDQVRRDTCTYHIEPALP